jgi:methylmalonyl-CoA mutase
MHTEFNIAGDFPPVSYEQWRAVAEADLRGASFEQKLVTHTYEGIDIQPLYSRRDEIGGPDPWGLPGSPPFVRGSRPLGAALEGWDLRQECAHLDLAAGNRAILDDLAGGANSLQLRLDGAARNGLDPDNPAAAEATGVDGLMAYDADDLDAVMSDVQVSAIGLSLDAGAAFLPAAALVASLCQRRGIALAQLRAAFNADPLSALSREGEFPITLPTALSLVGDLATWTSRNCPYSSAVGIDTSAYHQAGATAAQDIAFGVATGVEYLRAMTAARLSVDDAARQMLFTLSLGTHHFLAICKLRAARQLWSLVIEASGGSPAAGAMRIHAQTSRRVLTRRDPYVNLLRNTVSLFAAAVGGAESITSEPFDAAIGLPDDFSRRIARNTLHILREEGQLNRVVDPAGGSWFLDRLTQQIAERAWDVFQQIERQGGMAAALTSGWVAAQIESAFVPRAKDISRRKEAITGVSEFPDAREQRADYAPPDVAGLRATAARRIASRRRPSDLLGSLSTATDRTAAAIAAATDGATIGQLAQALGFHRQTVEIPPIELRAFAEPFEELRDAADAWQTSHGKRPTVFLANLGAPAHYTARAAYAKNFFAAGGFAVVASDGFRDAKSAAGAFAASGASVAVICSSDKLYPELVPEVAAKLKATGARSIVLAGNPGANEDAWRSAGVDRFIYIKCDVVATLREMLREEGVFAGLKDEGGTMKVGA